MAAMEKQRIAEIMQRRNKPPIPRRCRKQNAPRQALPFNDGHDAARSTCAESKRLRKGSLARARA